MRCPNCGGYDFDSEDRCLNCGYSIPSRKPPAWWGGKDFQGPERMLPYGKKGDKEHHLGEADSSEGSEPGLRDCPHCLKHSLFWNKYNQMYECLNIDCLRRFNVSEWMAKELVLYLEKRNELLEAYEKETELNPKNAEAWRGKGSALSSLGRHQESLEAYEKATEVDPENSIASLGKARALHALQRYEEALEVYEKATELNPKNVKAWLGKGSVLSSLRRYKESAAAYEKATEVDPEDDLALLGKARALHHLQRHRESLGAYEKVIELAPEDFIGWLGKGLALLHLQRYQEALKAYQKATEVEARHAEAWLGKGRALYMLERYEEALEAFENATEIDPKGAAAWRGKTLALDRMGRYQEAKEASIRANELEVKHSAEAEGLPESSSKLEDAHSMAAETSESYLTDPLLLGVKMFLADIRSWRQQYRESEYMCGDFTKEVYDAATEKGIRCGYVIVHFEASVIAHAIVCFQTDYGLKFIEPQSGEEESVVVGRPYPVIMQGVPGETIVSMVEIKWNDGTSTVIS